jgi:hypothetical protein
VRASSTRTFFTGLAAIGAALGLTLSTTAAARVTAAAIPGGTVTYASGQPKLDYLSVYGGGGAPVPTAGTWSNVCGVGTWTWNQYYTLHAIRMPTSPYHRIWLHQNADGSGWAVCFYSTGGNVSIPFGYDNPGNIQVSANTARC